MYMYNIGKEGWMCLFLMWEGRGGGEGRGDGRW